MNSGSVPTDRRNHLDGSRVDGCGGRTDHASVKCRCSTLYRLAERAVDAGLGVTAHAGGSSTANIAAAAHVPGLTRIGRAAHAARDPPLLELLAVRGIAVECCLSCNVVLGAVPSYEEHPIRQLAENGVAVALGTDDPVQVCTTIGREYALAAPTGSRPPTS